MWNFFRSFWRPASSVAANHLRYKFQIPDWSRPIAGEPPPWGPFCELVDFEPQVVTAEQVVGRIVCEICPQVGTYGMGGPGFFGLRFGDEWLVITLWGAAAWIQVNGRMVQNDRWEENGMPEPWITIHDDVLTEHLIGLSISSYHVDRHSLTIGVGDYSLSIVESPEGRPVTEGSKQPRIFAKDDDLRRAVFLFPTNEIWIC